MENELKTNKKNYELITKSPGKILICGGYLIINPEYKGLAVTTKTYFESRGRLEIFDKNEGNDLQTTIQIEIYSKNFKQSFYYKIDILFKNPKENLVLVINFERFNNNNFQLKFDGDFKSDNNSNRNNVPNDDFIVNSLKSAIYYLLLHQNNSLDHEEFLAKLGNKDMFIKIDLEADYRFYGFEKNLEQSNIDKNIKTGLGSSSALVSSLTSNIILNFCQYLNNIEIKSTLNEYNDELKLCSLLAAINANNQAQKKV